VTNLIEYKEDDFLDNKVLGIAVVTLIIGFGIGYVISMNQITSLQSTIDSLESANTTTTTQFIQLKLAS
jgi:hypothetical protein